MTARPRTPAGVVGASVSATVLVALPSCLIGALGLVIRTDQGFSALELSLAVGAFFLASALASLVAGRLALAERIGARASIFAGLGASALVMAFIAWGATGWVDIGVGLALAGVGNAIVQAGANLAIARRVPPARMGLALGVKQAALPAATLLAGLAVGLLAVLGGWRVAWWIGAAATAAFALVAMATTSTVRPRATARGDVRRARRRHAGLRPTASLMRVIAASILASMGANAMRVFFVETAVARGEALSTAGFLLVAASVVAIATRLVGGWRSDRAPRHPYASAASLMVAGAFGYLLMGVATGTWMLLAAAVLGISAGWGWSALVQLGAVRAHPDTPAAASSFVHFGGLFGNLLGPIVLAVLLPWSVGIAWAIIAAASAAGAVLMLIEAVRRS